MSDTAKCSYGRSGYGSGFACRRLGKWPHHGGLRCWQHRLKP